MKKSRKSLKNNSVSKHINTLVTIALLYVLIGFISVSACVYYDLAAENTFTVAIISGGVSAFFSGFITGIKFRKNGMIKAIIITMPINFIILLTSLIFNGFKADINMLFSILILEASAAVGGILSVNSKIRK